MTSIPSTPAPDRAPDPTAVMTQSSLQQSGVASAAASERPERPGLLRRLALDTGYAVGTLPLVVLGFVVTVVGLAAGLGLLVIWVGVGVLVGTVLVSRGLAHLERQRLRNLLLRDAPSPRYLEAPDGASGLRRLLTPLRDPQSWLDTAWGIVGFVTGLIAFCVTVTWWAGALGGLTYWFWQQWLPEDDVTLVELMGLGEGQRDESILYLVFGVVLLLTLPFVVRAMALLHGGTASALLCSRAALQQEVRRVTGSREAAHAAEAQSLRRLERDIHDGPQQRLVRLTMDLGRARKQLAEDPDRAGATIESALHQARETVDELRSLSRGIAPPLLVDRGLRVALEEMLRGSAISVEANLDLPEHLPPHVETTVYFVIAEALTNIAKHSGAHRARVDVGVVQEGVAVRIEDDGIGGAHESKGRGLAGLRQRLAGVDGALEVDSPDGGPTLLEAWIPLAEAR